MADNPGLAIGVGPEEHVTQTASAKKQQAARTNITAVLSHGGIFFSPPAPSRSPPLFTFRSPILLSAI